jgi:uncharacterized protein
VFRSTLDRRISGPGLLEDHAAVALAFLDLYSHTFDTGWLRQSREIAERTVEHFFDRDSDTWYDTASDHERLLVRPREVTDNATPSGTSLVAELLLRWSEVDEKPEWRAMADTIVSRVGDAIAQYPQALGHVAGVAESIVNGGVQVAIAGDPTEVGFRSLEARLGKVFVPGLVIAGGDPAAAAQPALMRGRSPADGQATAYVCRGFTCDLPTTDPATLEHQVRELMGAGTRNAALRPN